MYLLNEFKKKKGDKNSKVRKDKGVKRKPGLLSLKNNSYGGYISKGATGLAVGSGVLAGIAAAPAGIGLVIPAAALSAASSAPTGAILGAATKGTRSYLQKKKILKKDKYGE